MIRAATAPRIAPDRLTSEVAGADASAWLICRVATMRCALPVEQVIEVMRVLPLEPVAGVPSYVRGLSIIRGVPVPVVEVGLIIGDAATLAARLVTLRAAGRIVALAMDEIIGVAAIAAEAFGQLPPLLQNAAAGTIAALGTLDSELLVVLRASRLVPDDVFERLDAVGAPP